MSAVVAANRAASVSFVTLVSVTTLGIMTLGSSTTLGIVALRRSEGIIHVEKKMDSL